MSSSITVEIPSDLKKLSGLTLQQLEELNKLLLAIELYLEGKISIGKAAELSGLKFDIFHDELQKRKIQRRVHSTREELDHELDEIKQFLQQ